MTDSQFAVFHFDVKTMVMSGDTLMIFDNLADAERHCQSKIAATPALGCRIYNNQGSIVRTFSDDRLFAKHHGRAGGEAQRHRRQFMPDRGLGWCSSGCVDGVAADAWGPAGRAVFVGGDGESRGGRCRAVGTIGIGLPLQPAQEPRIENEWGDTVDYNSGGLDQRRVQQKVVFLWNYYRRYCQNSIMLLRQPRISDRLGVAAISPSPVWPRTN